MTLTTISFFLLVVIEEIVTLTLLGCHQIFFQVFIMVNYIKKGRISSKKFRQKNRGAAWLQTKKCRRKRRNRCSIDADK